MRLFVWRACLVVTFVCSWVVGIGMIPVEFVVNLVACLLGAEDVTWDCTFVLRQATDLETYKALWNDSGGRG